MRGSALTSDSDALEGRFEKIGDVLLPIVDVSELVRVCKRLSMLFVRGCGGEIL